MININIDINQTKQLAVEMGEPIELNAEMDKVVYIPRGDPYEGNYDVIPNTVSNIVLETKNKFMKNNVTVHKIPYEEVTNAQGGKTATIGGF